jgi:hypothetical protein
LLNEEFLDKYFPDDQTKEEHVALIGRTRNVCRILVGKLEEKKQLGRPNVDGNDSIKLEKWDVRAWTGLIWLGIGTSGGLL